jgi:hypothetical protein
MPTTTTLILGVSRLRVAHAALVDAAAQWLAAGDASDGADMHRFYETSARLRTLVDEVAEIAGVSR